MTVTRVNYVSAHHSKESAQPSVAENPAFWWPEQREFICLPSQEVQHRRSWGDAVTGSSCQKCQLCFPSSALQSLALPSCWTLLSCRQELLAPTSSWGSDLHSKQKGVYRGGRIEQFLKNKRRQEAPPAQAFILPDLPNTQGLDSYSCTSDNSQYPNCYSLVISVMPDPLRSHGLQPARLLCPRDSSGKNTGVGFNFLLQGIFPTQGLNP